MGPGMDMALHPGHEIISGHFCAVDNLKIKTRNKEEKIQFLICPIAQ